MRSPIVFRAYKEQIRGAGCRGVEGLFRVEIYFVRVQG